MIATITLTAAQIKALHGTPVELVPAPGAGFIILPVNFAARLHFGTIQFANGAPINLYLGPVANDYEFAMTDLAFAQRGQDWFIAGQEFGNFFTFAHPADVDNKALFISTNGPEYINGDGLITITLAYVLAAIS